MSECVCVCAMFDVQQGAETFQHQKHTHKPLPNTNSCSSVDITQQRSDTTTSVRRCARPHEIAAATALLSCPTLAFTRHFTPPLCHSSLVHVFHQCTDNSLTCFSQQQLFVVCFVVVSLLFVVLLHKMQVLHIQTLESSVTLCVLFHCCADGLNA